MTHLWLHELTSYTGMGEGEISFCIVHLGFPVPRPTSGGFRWAAWEVDRWLAAEVRSAA